MQQNIISLRNLIFDYVRTEEDNSTKTYRALNDISLDIVQGSFVAIIGRNGSGKSTLAKCLNGLLLPTSGEVLVNEMSTADDSKIWDIRSSVAMVFQNPDNQIVSSIVEDDVAFGPENLGVNPEEIRQRVDQALREVGMYECRDKGAHMLSGGQKQRIAIAGAVAMRPDCIVFDEPTAMLDPRGRRQVMSIIKKLNSEKITTILITHYMEEAAEADRVIVMNEGRVISDSTPAELFINSSKLKEAGMSMPPIVDLRERLSAKGIDIPSDIMTEDELAAFVRSRRDARSD